MKNKKKNKGFTLIELVIVIAIIAILISIAAMRYSSTNLAAEAAAHNANVKVLKSAGILYFIDNPDKKGDISAEDLKPYLEGGKIPKPAKHLDGAKDFTVKSTDDGDVEVSPGPIKVQDKKLVEDNESWFIYFYNFITSIFIWRISWILLQSFSWEKGEGRRLYIFKKSLRILQKVFKVLWNDSSFFLYFFKR